MFTKSAAALAVLQAVAAAPRPFSMHYNLAANFSIFTDPTVDPFYVAPDNLTAYNPGDVIRSRSVDTILNSTNSFQLLYRSNNNFGEPEATVTTVYAPNTPASEPRILSYQDPIDSPQLDCAPSWALYEYSNSTNAPLLSTLGAVILGAAQDLGAHLVISDFQGPNATWIVGRQEGHATLDGIRAAANYYALNNASVTMAGYSGGAHATAWAATLAEGYAPEINFVGAAFGGTPTELNATLQALDGGPNVLLAIGSLVGLAAGYPELNATVDSALSPLGQNLSSLLHRNNYCVTAKEAEWANTSIATLFTTDIINSPLAVEITRNESLLSNVSLSTVPVPKFPRFEWHGLADEIIPYWTESAYVQQQCSQGANIIFNSYANASHTGAAIAGLGNALLFIAAAYNGSVPTVTCGTEYNFPA